jgi:hypothetical protein
METLSEEWTRGATGGPIADNEAQPDRPPGISSKIENCISSREGDMSAPLESIFRVEPGLQMKVKYSHSAFPKAELREQSNGICPPDVARAAAEPGDAKLAHETPKTKRKRSPSTSPFFTTGFIDNLWLRLSPQKSTCL